MKMEHIHKSHQVLSLRKGLIMFLLACIPFLVLGVLFLVLKRSPADFHLMGSDEMDYWIESATIMKRGLLAQNTGYFGTVGKHMQYY